MTARILAALYSPIQDCDEVYNFWEPTHFLTHGWGLQTWEWSPVYAIRSWSYVGLHATIVKALMLLGAKNEQLFWGLRISLAICEAFVESRLVNVLSRRFNYNTAALYVAISAPATGMFHASVSYLPSSFAMYSTALATAYFLESPVLNVVKYLTIIAIGGLLGWPFALVTALPLGLYYTVRVGIGSRWIRAATISAVIIGSILILITAVDSLVFHKFAVVPFNIVAYNVLFTDADVGPDIFGTEPWTYYILNGLLNFNLIFPIAFLSILLFTRAKLIASISPFYLWFCIFMSQPHKEERFLYVVYPLICLSAAFALSRVPRPLAWILVSFCAVISISRNTALSSFYTAPFDVYAGVPENSSICVGREWYRYPSSYFNEGHLKFVESGYRGLLPGEFVSFSAIPDNMNPRNEFDPSKITSLDECDYLVELNIPVNPQAGEIDPRQYDEWEVDKCSLFLDADSSTGLSRLLYFGMEESPLGILKRTQYCRYRHVRQAV